MVGLYNSKLIFYKILKYLRHFFYDKNLFCFRINIKFRLSLKIIYYLIFGILPDIKLVFVFLFSVLSYALYCIHSRLNYTENYIYSLVF